MSDDLFLRACRGEDVPRTPIWIMRQAGRYLPEYRAVREQADFLTVCHTPELAARVTLQPIERFGFDAAILFSDILMPAEAMGFEVAFTPGPVLARPVREAADVERIRLPEAEEALPYVYETIRIVRRELGGRAPLIGFAAAPFTLALYLVEGRGSKDHAEIKRLLYGAPEVAHRLLDRVATMTERHLLAQVRAGAEAVQLFDSWAGLLDRASYREFALPAARRVLDALRETGVPRIYFALDAAHLHEDVREAGADVYGVDWRLPLDEAAARLGGSVVLQGNLDPAVLLAPPRSIEREAARVLEAGHALRGHVFNLGHGILPDTPVAHVETLVETVRSRPR